MRPVNMWGICHTCKQYGEINQETREEQSINWRIAHAKHMYAFYGRPAFDKYKDFEEVEIPTIIDEDELDRMLREAYPLKYQETEINTEIEKDGVDDGSEEGEDWR